MRNKTWFLLKTWVKIDEFRSLITYIQGHNFITRHVRVALHAAMWAPTSRHIDAIKCHDNIPSVAFVTRNERSLGNYIWAHGNGYHSPQLLGLFLQLFEFLLRGPRNCTTWTYRLQVKLAICGMDPPVNNAKTCTWRHASCSFSTRTRSRFTCNETSVKYYIISHY